MPAIPLPNGWPKNRAKQDESGARQYRQVKRSVGGSKSTSPDRKKEATMISKDLGALGFLVFILVATSEGEIYVGRRKGIQLPPITLVQFLQQILQCYGSHFH